METLHPPPGDGGRSSETQNVIVEALCMEFGRAIERELSFLVSLGYQFVGVTEDSTDALGARLSGGYSNAAVNRAVRVIYLPGFNARRSVAITNVSLIEPDPIDEYDYTTIHSMGVCVTDLSGAGDFATGFNQHLRDVARLLRDRFGSVLAGGDWQSDELNWGDLK